MALLECLQVAGEPAGAEDAGLEVVASRDDDHAAERGLRRGRREVLGVDRRDRGSTGWPLVE
jgi:hypothetical protein